ncbi:hypothetical protein ACJ41O_004982 [Fusarium nematophilum]
MASKHPLRRSCAFCRARKIKCSNETICEACRKQGADCIYDFEPTRSKGRNLSIDSTKANLLHVRSDQGLPESKRRRSCSASSAPSTPGSRNHDDFGHPDDSSESIAAALEQRFLEKFPQGHGQDAGDQIKFQQQQPRPKDVKYTGPLSLLAHDLVSLVIERFGSLGYLHDEDSSGRFFRSGLSSDDTPTMFDSPPPESNPLESNPLSDYGTRQRTQLIDVWYSMHPLSFLISKTLFLREVRDNTCDEVLLAVMLADASFVLGDDITIRRGGALLRWARSQLQNRPLCQQPKDGDSVHSGMPTRVYKGVSTAQAMVLMAWNALYSYEFRRAACYVDVARKVVAGVKDCMSSDSSPPNSSRINGVDVLDVEKEIVAYLWWTTFSLSLWASLQTGRLPEATPATFALDSLPMTEASSVMIQLDLVSENFSTLQKQKSSMREMWPLAHIASTVAYLFLHSSDQAAARNGLGVCREAIRLFSGTKNKKSAVDCKGQIYPGRLADDTSSRRLLLAFHHTMAVQFLFPKNASFQDQGSPPADTVDQFCSSAEEVIQYLSLAPAQHHDPFAITPSIHPSLPKALCLLLDTCSRAFSFIRTNLGLSLNETYFHQGWDGRLFPLANRLYAISKDDRFHQGTAVRAMRKQLKACAKSFGAPDASSNSLDISVPGGGDRMRSVSHSPQGNMQAQSYMAAGGTRMADASSPFSCVDESSRVSSSMPSSSGSSASVSTQPFNPLEGLSKWQISDGYPHAMLSPPAPVPHSVPEGAGMQNMWYSQAPVAMNFEAAGPISIQLDQWGWPSTSAEEATYLSFQALDMDEGQN